MFYLKLSLVIFIVLYRYELQTRDMSVSEEIEKFLDMYFYPEFVMKEIHLLNIFGHYLVTIIMHNIVIMIRKPFGRDTKVVYKNKKMIIDEKQLSLPNE